jgi:two-component system phosphate regulon sensor histidine kinase PhoR
MKKFKVRLTIIFIVLIGLSMTISGLYMAQMFQKTHITALEENMTREINIINDTLSWDQVGTREEDEMQFLSKEASLLSKSSGARVTFIRQDGKVLGDSDHTPNTMDNHLNRLEIVKAKEKGLGSEIRYSNTLHENMLYVAVPISNTPHFEGYIRLAMSISKVEHSIRSLWFVLTMGLLVLFVIAGIISYRIAHNLTRPLEKITRVANQISHMNYRSRVDIKNKDEIGQLSVAINTMADSLQVQMNQIHENENRLKNVLEHMINGIIMVDPSGRIVLVNKMAENILGIETKHLLSRQFSDVKQQYEMIKLIKEGLDKKELLRDEVTIYFPEERLLEVNVVPMFWEEEEEDFGGILVLMQDLSAIRRLERMRSEFVANVSHELKTPIAAVKGFAETLLSGAVSDPNTANSFLQIIYDESERLNRLIGDILELSKIESKRVPLQFSPVELHSFVGSTVDVLRTEAGKKQIDLQVSVPEQLYAEADEDRLRQIILNLVSNGINYTPDGGLVKVILEPMDMTDDGDYEKIRLIISDTGIGIPKADLPRIFERFYRVDKARSRSSGGTGLGLSIVKHLVDSHEGTIRVESEIGVGTRFIIEIPVVHEQ